MTAVVPLLFLLFVAVIFLSIAVFMLMRRVEAAEASVESYQTHYNRMYETATARWNDHVKSRLHG